MKKIKIYVASPLNPEYRKEQINVVNYLREKGFNVYYPAEHKIKNDDKLDNITWGKKVFLADVRNIKNSDLIVLLSYGRLSSAGHNWEAGYGYGLGKKIITIEMTDNIMSLMISNSSHSVIKYDELGTYDFEKLLKMKTNTEQK